MAGRACAGLLGLAMVILSPLVAAAADIKSSSGKDGRMTILITGEIEPGDADSFSVAVKEANNAGKLVVNIRLNSEGGNLLEGVKLADAVRYGKMSTNVGKNATCASACFLIFAAGSTKFATYDAKIGVHGASDEDGSESVQSGAATVSMARIAKELGVPSAIIGRMVVTPPNEMVWLAPQDLQSMGTTMVGKPSQTQSTLTGPPSQVPPSPTQITPETSSKLNPIEQTAPTTNKPPPTWGSILDRAIALSKDQNGGVAAFDRGCQPEFKVCINALSFKLKDGTNMIMKVTEDMNGKMLRREICTFNSYHDVRSCTNWDSGETHKDMKNTKGEWEQISRE
jgi:hypothetical protein